MFVLPVLICSKYSTDEMLGTLKICRFFKPDLGECAKGKVPAWLRVPDPRIPGAGACSWLN